MDEAMRIFKYIKKLLSKKPELPPKPSPKKDPYAPRGKNKIYPNDEFGQAHMEKWLDEIYWKHHG